MGASCCCASKDTDQKRQEGVKGGELNAKKADIQRSSAGHSPDVLRVVTPPADVEPFLGPVNDGGMIQADEDGFMAARCSSGPHSYYCCVVQSWRQPAAHSWNIA